MQESERLVPHLHAVIAARANDVSISVVSIWEIAIKSNLGKLQFPMDHLDEMLESNEIATIGIETRHAVVAGGLPRHHNDPFDRMLIAQAMVEGLTIVTADRAFARYDVPLLGQPA